jgi:hypothetical protein
MKLFDRVQFTTTTTGAGDLTGIAAVRSASDGDWLTPAEAGVANGDAVPYVIANGANFAKGRGVYSTTGPTLQRDTNEIRWTGSGSPTTAKLSLTSGARVFISPLAAVLALRDEALTQTSAGSLTPDIGNYSIFRFTALAANLTINAPIGTPYDSQRVRFEFQDDGTERTIAWNAAWGYGFAVKPSTTGNSSTFSVWVEFIWSAARTRWVCTKVDVEPVLYASLQYVGGVTHSGSVSPGSTASTTLHTLTGGLATAPSEGDLVIVALTQAGTADVTQTMSTAGYTKFAEVYSNDGFDTNLAVFWKVMGSTPDSSAVSAGVTGTVPAMAVHVWRGADPTTPFGTPQTATGINGGNPDPPAVTPDMPGQVIIVVGGSASDSSANHTASDLDNFVKRFVGDTFDPAVGIGSKAGTMGVSFDPAAWSGGDATATASWAAITGALRPKTLN